MEERMIDDEYGRGVRMKKTKDGFVDVTDELAKDDEIPETAGEEIEFQFPVMDGEEDDEDLVGLTPEEAAALKKRKEEEAAARKAEYERLCAEGETLLGENNFGEAEKVYEKALGLDGQATVASVGYWRAKTADFTDPDELIGEYVEAGIESLEYDLGYEAAEIVKRDYREVFEKRVTELTAEETPLAKEVEAKQAARREILSARRKSRGLVFGLVAIPTLVCLIAAIVLGLKNFTTPDAEYIMPTIVLGCVFAVLFIVFLVVANKFINACRIYRINERLSSTDEGERLLAVRAYKELYEALLVSPEEETEAEQD
ncbi:MAG: hypothetical protein IJZ32_03295 [Clostridia bacterium]|nr:hypothetical protein [Clostridia bacterium]